MKFLKKKYPKKSSDEIEELYLTIDKDNDGNIDAAEAEEMEDAFDMDSGDAFAFADD